MLPWETKVVCNRHDLYRVGEQSHHCSIVVKGLLAKFAQTFDGKRQILSIYLPGDIANLQAMLVPETGTGFNALTATTVRWVQHQRLLDLVDHFPAIKYALWRDCIIESQMLAQRLICIGRRNAKARIAYFLCEIAERYDVLRRSNGCKFQLSMNQEQIGDALGLTSVHVNRTIKELRDEGIISIAEREVRIADVAALKRIGEFDPSYLRMLSPCAKGTRSGDLGPGAIPADFRERPAATL